MHIKDIRYGGMEFPAYAFKEYPKVVRARNADGTLKIDEKTGIPVELGIANDQKEEVALLADHPVEPTPGEKANMMLADTVAAKDRELEALREKNRLMEEQLAAFEEMKRERVAQRDEPRPQPPIPPKK